MDKFKFKNKRVDIGIFLSSLILKDTPQKTYVWGNSLFNPFNPYGTKGNL